MTEARPGQTADTNPDTNLSATETNSEQLIWL
jgi:hypothetical protein